ncbi:type I polyketide synthase [Mangrovihabitans endophyticus]|uniref:Polyketide synthase n=1 Tax=Mangrovihabitans endophyticus TaxID=1751298 RepID=A0A8J3FLI0_9ACTN|nr:type I polyketide synthase [Mangrovihabitans endophyticus]GGK76483.1 polyketide synthase [Mangrovihabitans endophyticus]
MAESVVIVGMACRYAGAADTGQLWETVLSRRVGFRRIPPGRLPLAEYGGTGPDQTYVTHAALLDGWQFDRTRFRVPGSTFRAVDMAHWLALEVSSAALADAGLRDGAGLDRQRAGVILGNSLTGEFSRATTLRTRWPYVRRATLAALASSAVPPQAWDGLLDELEQRFKEPFPEPSDETLAGALANTIAGRVCNHFDLQGVGYTVDGACASSLLAVANAASAVADGHLEVALAGGVDLSVDPFELIGFARVGALATGGDMRVYDRNPTGFLPGEGCGVVVLCRESYARRRGLRPYARLLGWGASSDGSGGLTRPELRGQRLALRRAYERARIAPDRVALIEGHGTGTEVGDRTELSALLELRTATAPVAALGSVKANIGHTKAAAGVAGLIKATLAVDHEVLPPATGCADPHPLLADRRATLQALDEARCWPPGERYAGVSAMGFGGINVHAVLGGVAPTRRQRLNVHERHLAARHPGREVIACAAPGAEHLDARLAVLRDAARFMSRAELTDLAATLATERGEGPARFAAAVADAGELVAAVEHARTALAAGTPHLLDRTRRVFLATRGPLRVGLLCSGQAAPCYPDAGALAGLLDELPPGYHDPLPLPSPVTTVDTAVAQPAIVRAALAGLRWLARLGVRPHGALGHSLGEIVALAWAGAIDEAQAYDLARARGAAMSAIDTAGGMASLSTTPAVAAELIRGRAVVVAADNGPAGTVVSGPRGDLESVLAEAARRGVPATRLPVSHAFHSPLMTPAASRVKSAAAEVPWRPLDRPVASTITGTWLHDEDPVELLVRQLTGPVRFREALSALDADLLVEVGPGRVLTGMAGPGAVALDAGSPSADGVATATAALFAAGACPSVAAYTAHRFSRRFDPDRSRVLLTNPCEAAAPASPRDAPPRRVSRPAPPVPSGDAAPFDDAVAADPVAVAVARVAEAVELDPATIGARAHLLADLHLSSLRVAQLAVRVATDLGRALPDAATPVASATVREFAEAIAALPPARPDDSDGATGWVRAFTTRTVPESDPPPHRVTRRWHLVGDLAAHPLRGALRAAFPTGGDGPAARLLALPPGLDAAGLPDAVRALRDCHADRIPLVVLHHAGFGAAVGRSLAAEASDVPVLVVEAAPDDDGVAAAAIEAHRPLGPYAEISLVGGTRTAAALHPATPAARDDARIGLRHGDPCVVTGGARGIGAECAAGLAAATGARMILLGRADPGHEEVCATLDRVTSTGAPAEYHRTDVTDAAGLAAVLRGVRDRHGPVRAVLHAAGHNEPAPLTRLSVDAVRAALAPKADGLENVLAAVDPAELRFLVTFGSVIGRTGLPGEAHYAIANEWLARRCAELAARLPGVRWLNVEWSAWSGTGMGERLGVLDGLVRRGLTPIPAPAGVDMLLRLLATPGLPPSVLVAGRLPAMATLRWHDDREPGGDRFLESVLSRTPGVETRAQAALSLGADPYLADHRIDGSAVLPAVFGLEAMAQAAGTLGAGPGPVTVTGVSFARAVTVPERASRTLRVTALAAEDGAVETAVRSDATGMRADHFRAVFRSGDAGPDDDPAPPPADAIPVPAGRLYGPLFFHGPRFRRVTGYHALGAYRCAAQVHADPQARWFGPLSGSRLLLGDPGARDAFLHLLQGCVPDRRVLPVAVERIRTRGRLAGRLRVDAWQRTEDGDDFVFDLVVTDEAGAPVERWDALTLRAVGPVTVPRWPLPVLGAYLTRLVRRRRPGCPVDLVVTGGDGSPSIGGHRLSAVGPRTSAADWRIVARAAPSPPPAAAAFASAGDPPERAAARAAGLHATLRGLGASPQATPTVRVPEPGGWTEVAADGCTIISVVVPSDAGPVAATVGWR